MKRIFLAAPLFFLVAACAGPSVQGEKKAECYVRYLAPESQSFAEVRLLEETPGQNSMKAVESPAGVRYQGVLMRMLDAQGITYRLEQGGGYAPQHRFEWQDNREKPQAFEMQLPAITGFTFGADAVSNKNPATLRLEGAPLDRQETIVMIWESADGQGFTIPMEISASQGQDKIEFPAAQMGKIPTGTWSLYLVRKKRVKTELNGTTVLGVAEYYSQSDTIRVFE